MHSSLKGWRCCLAALAAAIALTACNLATLTVPQHKKAPPTVGIFPQIPASDIDREVAVLESELVSAGTADSRASLHWRLALLYAHPDNQTADHRQAGSHLKQLREVAPNAPTGPIVYLDGLIRILAANAEKMRWLRNEISDARRAEEQHFLKRLQSINARYKHQQHQEQEQREALQAQYETLQRQYQLLVDENRTMRNTLEELERLDLQLEERRSRNGS